MKPNVLVAIASALVALLSCSCSTSPPADFAGRWTPVNRYAAAPEEIPLAQAYVFAPSPLDRTLKTMLTRWATDSNRTLQYLHPSDFALYAPVTGIHTSRLDEAVARINGLYVQQRVVVTLDGAAIIVRKGEDTHVAATPERDASVH